MNPIVSVALITAAWFMVYSTSQNLRPRDKPEKCVGNPDMLMRFCCALPPFFARDVAVKCGSAMRILEEKFNVTKLLRYSYSCQYWYCLLDQYAFISTDGRVDHEKFFSHLDLWVTLNPSFTDVMIDAKHSCKQFYRYFFPMKICEFYKLNHCFRRYLSVYYPVIIPSAECIEQNNFYKECGIYFT